MLVVSSNDIPGYDIEVVLGEVFGITVRSTNFGSLFASGFRAIQGGEIPQMTQLVLRSRNEAMGRMIYLAQQRGANAIIAFRFDNGEIQNTMTQVCAYGTAVWAVPVTERAKLDYEAMRSAGRMPHQQEYATNISDHGPAAAH